YRGILETAGSVGADLIVMGSHGRRGLEKLVLGSVAAQVLAHAHLPILIVRD
ncbi:MAG: universal stress protein, partial [Polaromonas sp.]|nr:universal stress protein [Polaromonas sp.]